MKLSMAPSTIPEGTVSIGGLKNVSQVGIPDIGVTSRARWLRYLLLKNPSSIFFVNFYIDANFSRKNPKNPQN